MMTGRRVVAASAEPWVGPAIRLLESSSTTFLASDEHRVECSLWLLLPRLDGFKVCVVKHCRRSLVGSTAIYDGSSAVRECAASGRVGTPEHAQRRNKEISVSVQNDGREGFWRHDRPKVPGVEMDSYRYR